MTTKQQDSSDTAPSPGGQQEQRHSLERSERDASRPQPESYDPRNTNAKIVTIPPVDGDSQPIHGLDPASK